VVLAGSATHFPVAFLLFYVVISGLGLPEMTTTVRSVQATLEDGSATPAAGPACRRGTPSSPWTAPPPRVADLVDAISSHPGETVALSVERAGETLVVPVDLAAVADGEGGPAATWGSPGHQDGAGRAGDRAGPGRGALGEAVVASGHGLWDLVTGVPRLLGAVLGGNVQDVGRTAR